MLNIYAVEWVEYIERDAADHHDCDIVTASNGDRAADAVKIARPYVRVTDVNLLIENA